MNIRGGGGGGGGGKGGKLFASCLLIEEPYPHFRPISVPKNYISHIKTDNRAKLRIELKSILLAIPSFQIKVTYIKLVHL